MAAHVLFGQVAKAYQALTSYSDQGEFVVAMTLGGKAHRQVRPLKLTFVRPNKLDLDAGAVRLTSDGKTMTTVIEPLEEVHDVAGPRDGRHRHLPRRTDRRGALRRADRRTDRLAGVRAAQPALRANPDVMLDQMGGTLHAAQAAAASRKAPPS